MERKHLINKFKQTLSTFEIESDKCPVCSSNKYTILSNKDRYGFILPYGCCQKCGLIAIYNHEKNIHVCNTCKNYTHFNKVNVPYSFKLLMQELITMNIAPRIKC